MKNRTRIVHAGRHPEQHNGAVNPPVYHVSTVVYPTVAAMHEGERHPYDGMRYGRYGTPTSFALEEAVAALEGGYRTVSVGSGLAAITATLDALLSAGDHVLVTDSAYFPTRNYCDKHLSRLGVQTTYYDPAAGSGIADLIRSNTKLVFVESPGSLTFEIQDIPAIAEAAHKAGALVAMDNTWATPLFFKPFEKGVDVSIQAATKFIVGHSDAMLGTITCADKDLWKTIKTSVALSGNAAGADEVYLGLRGLRTLDARLRLHQESGLAVARWLESRPEVGRVIHPALPSHPGHELWKRDFLGACGLFAVELVPGPETAVAAMLDGLEHFGLGYSWGGFESLVIPTTGKIPRSAVPWSSEGPTLRLHIGLEDPSDLIADLESGLERFSAVK